MLAFDVESHLIQPGMLAPRLVCLSHARRGPLGPIETGLVKRTDGLQLLRGWLEAGEILIAHNATFDLGVCVADDPALLPLVFDAYDRGLVQCTIVRQKVLDVALGMRKWRRAGGRVTRAGYGLDDLTALYLGRVADKGNAWRLRFAELEDVPLAQWPPEAVAYSLQDSVDALEIHEAQSAAMLEYFGSELPNQTEQQRAAWALHLMSMWGIRAEGARVEAFEGHCREVIASMERELYELCEGCGQPRGAHAPEGCAEGVFRDSAIFRVDKKGALKRNDNGTPQRVMAEIMRRVRESLERQSVAVPLTPTGLVQTDRDTLLLTDDPALHVLAKSMTFAKHLGQWGPVLRAAVQRPVCCRYDVLAETGRTACSGSEGQEGTNIQNPPRDGDVRPAVVPRPGWLFCSTDADAVELVAHAENCLTLVGWSRTAETIVHWKQSGGPDPHEALAASIVGATPAEVQAACRAGDKDMADARQFAKIPQYGFLGDMYERTFVAFARAQLKPAQFLKWFDANPRAAEAKGRRIREAWLEYAPENRVYFDLIDKMVGGRKGYGTVTQLVSGRIRGGVRYRAALNGFFQGRVADAMKEILWRLAVECYTGRCTSVHAHGGSAECTHEGRAVLAGSRPVMFLHDEPILEHPEDGSEGARGRRQQAVVLEGLAKWFPRVPSGSTFVLMRRWNKGAKPIKGQEHLPVRPQKTPAGKTEWVHDDGKMS